VAPKTFGQETNDEGECEEAKRDRDVVGRADDGARSAPAGAREAVAVSWSSAKSVETFIGTWLCFPSIKKSASGGVELSVAGDGEEAAGVSSALPTTGVLGGGCTRSRPGGGVNANPPPSVASDGDLSAHLGGGVAADNGGVHGGSGGEVDGVEQSRDGQARE